MLSVCVCGRGEGKLIEWVGTTVLNTPALPQLELYMAEGTPASPTESTELQVDFFSGLFIKRYLDVQTSSLKGLLHSTLMWKGHHGGLMPTRNEGTEDSGSLGPSLCLPEAKPWGYVQWSQLLNTCVHRHLSLSEAECTVRSLDKAAGRGDALSRPGQYQSFQSFLEA